ncbi:MAG: class I SAM-dependent methyltransferase [Calothrix sp. MO_167.B12]|nr:class I SAM-dependent methyltransferase [Calothrix sp. MO_167.B12]
MKDTYKIQNDYYTQTATLYDEMHSDIEHDIALSYISNFIHGLNITSILDVGCGTGRGMKYFLENHQNISVQGIEPVKALVEVAIHKNNIPNTLISTGNGENLPFLDSSFDAVFELAMLYQIRLYRNDKKNTEAQRRQRKKNIQEI